MKIAILVAYFGKLPDYFQLFLNSCKTNPSFDWIIFSDDDSIYDYPDNVHFVKMGFLECKKLIQSKFDFQITLHKPQKLCDYKCAYGVIFEEYLQEYDWWGHCDLDQLFGDLNQFITRDILEEYDKLFSLGHLTLYRNSFDNNRVFMREMDGVSRYKEVFTIERGCAFDEWLPNNVNDIFLKSDLPIMLDNIGADINPYKTSFQNVYFDIQNRCYRASHIKNSIFEMSDGHIYQVYLENSSIKKREFPYVHLQKRYMKDIRKNKNSVNFFIVPNYFIDNNHNTKKVLYSCLILRFINYQYFKVKINSLRYRIKNSDWKFSNVFALENQETC